MKTTEDLLRELADREAIRDLPVRYCDCLWRKDLDGVIELFTEDCTFVIKGVEVEAASRGHGDLKRMHQKALAETNPRLFVHNQIVNLLGADRATGRCCVEVRNARIGMEWIGIGYFEDRYAKIGDEWKFASRVHSFDGIDQKIWLRTFIV
jgi:SnoaL-like domain